MHVYMHKLTWPCVYRGLHTCVPHVCTKCTCFIADFSVCDMHVKCVSHVTHVWR